MWHACRLMRQRREVLRVKGPDDEEVELAEIERFCREAPSR
jgi:hypothetical protein